MQVNDTKLLGSTHYLVREKSNSSCAHAFTFLAIKMPTCPGEDGQFQSNGGCLKTKHYYMVHDQTPHRQLINRLNRRNTATAIF